LVASLLLISGCGSVHVNGSFDSNWSFVALGDSLAAGFDAVEGYVPRYQSDIETDNPGVTVALNNLGQPGWQSSDLLNALKNDQGFRSAVSNAQVVTWDIGGNDLKHAYKLFLTGACGGADNQNCFRSAVTNFKNNWNGIVGEITSLRDPSPTILRTMDIYNPFIAEQVALGNLATVKPYLDETNTFIQASAAQNGILCAKVYAAFNGPSGTEDPVAKGLIAPDGFHANENGHKLMADLLRQLGYSPLR
jgi:lysophospholipase L1-like esterase